MKYYQLLLLPFVFFSMHSLFSDERMVITDRDAFEDLKDEHLHQTWLEEALRDIVPQGERPVFTEQEWSIMSDYMKDFTQGVVEEVITRAYLKVRNTISIIKESYSSKWRRSIMQVAYEVRQEIRA